MSDEKNVHRYWHAEHCGLYCDIKTSGTAEQQEANKDKGITELPCANCGEKVPAREVSHFEHERYTALEDDCENCGDVIVFLPDMLEWRHHEGEEVAVTEPVYGLLSCEAAMVRLMGLPVGTPMPDYAGMVATPAGNSGSDVVLNINSAEDAKAAEEEIAAGHEANLQQVKQRQTKRDVAENLAKFLRTVE